MATTEDLVKEMEDSFDELKLTFLQKIAVKARTALKATNAKLLGGMTSAEIIKIQTDIAAAHIASKENPHGINLAMLDAPTAAVVAAKTSGLIPRGTLPISRFGDFETGLILIQYSLSTIMITAQQVMMSGNPYAVPQTTFNLQTLYPDAWQNKKFYAYLKWDGSVASYQFSLTELVETASRMFIGTFTTGPTAIINQTFAAVTRIDNYRISTAPVGSAIPATTGYPMQTGTLNPGWFNS